MTITNRVSLKSVMAGVTPIADVPDAPTIGAATNVGTSRAFNNGSATVAYTAAPTGGTATTFTATSTPGSFTGTGTSPITVTGLQSATSYTFTVTPTNSTATGPASSSSSSITATTVPQAPTIGIFTDGGTGTTGTLSFTAGATGGSSITNYKYSTDSSTYTALSPAQTSSPLSLTGLTAGTYNFSVKAVNTNGDSLASGNASGTVITPSSFESIATVTTTSGQSSVTFSSIPQTYAFLQVRILSRINLTTWRVGSAITYNGNTSNVYTVHDLYGNDGSLYAAGSAAGVGDRPYVWAAANSSPTETFGVSIVDIHDYASTTRNKTTRIFTGIDNNNAAQGSINIASSLFVSTSAITSITFTPNAGTYIAGNVFALYGIKGA